MRNVYEIRKIVNRENYDVFGITLPKEIVTMAGGIGTSWHVEMVQMSGVKCIVLKSGCSYEDIKEKIKQDAKEMDLEDLRA